MDGQEEKPAAETMRGRRVLRPVNWGQGLVPIGSFVEEDVFDQRETDELIRLGVLGPEETAEITMVEPVPETAPAATPAAALAPAPAKAPAPKPAKLKKG